MLLTSFISALNNMSLDVSIDQCTTQMILMADITNIINYLHTYMNVNLMSLHSTVGTNDN